MDKEKSLVILDPSLKRGFTSVPNAVLFAPDLSMAAKCLYAVILGFAWQEDECFPGQERLAEACGCTDRTVRKYLDELKEYGLISWVQRGLNRPNIYYIHDLSKIERLKALKIKDRKELSGPDRKELSVLDRKELSDKEYSDQEYIVVVDLAPGLDDENKPSNENTGSSVEKDSAVSVLLPAKIKFEEDAAQNPDLSLKERPEWEEIREKVRDAAGAEISAGFANEILGKYPSEKVHSAIRELKRQVEHGVKINGVGAWLRRALERDFQPDQPARIVSKPEKKGGNNRTPRARPRALPETSYRRTPEEERKRKEFLRSLYI